MKIFFMLFVMLVYSCNVFAQEKQDMQMGDRHGNMEMEMNEMKSDHDQMTGGDDQIMGHPETMDGHMKTHHEHIKTMERVFRYERNLAEKAEEIIVGYLYRMGDRESEKNKDAMVMMAQSMVTEGLAGKKISFVPIGTGHEISIADQLAEEKINVIYIGENITDPDYEAAGQYAQNNKMLTIGSSGEQAERGITAVGIHAKSEKVDLIINLKAADDQGLEFDPRLYRLADKLIR